ncbi:flagellar hook protein FlgE [Wenxinia saemankumensis]|uniref:Flagellar hook protein FlgE n=1 Tax=Wenxinia saemankumensis TaxID=1447782 RepID=A0A1M6FQQ7_9RHOB|nr:flagellar hook-basal body complex protein [Wenxinia saemankumensis]SHI99995.1 flagellar hook protein FlgE [Wenxinia saemankumensis]
MTISSSLNAGVSGLSANASRLATIADNIANSSTYGYKRVITNFSSLVVSEGGTRHVAGGVRTSTTRLIDERGSLASSTNSTDLAVRGRGYLPITTLAEANVGNGALPISLTSTGSFRPNEDGILVSSFGHVLLGWPADADGNIPAFPRDTTVGLEPITLRSTSGRPTTEIDISLNLPATSTEAGAVGDPESISIEYFDNLGKSQYLSATFTPTVPATGASNEWTLTIEDDASGTVIGEYTLTFNDTNPGGGTLASVTPVSGGPYDPAAGTLALTLPGGPLTFSIGTLNEPGGLSQLSDGFAPISIDKNGYPVSNLTGVEVDANGFVHAFFQSGRSAVIYQIPLIDVPNPNGLQTRDGQSYGLTPQSGNMFLWDAGDGPTGDVIGFALEESSVDIAAELTSLIQTQRAYSSNAKVIQTVDDMLQETTNIKR